MPRSTDRGLAQVGLRMAHPVAVANMKFLCGWLKHSRMIRKEETEVLAIRLDKRLESILAFCAIPLVQT